MNRTCFVTMLLLFGQASSLHCDEFDSKVTIEGRKQFDNPFGGVFKQWFLRSFIDKQTHKVNDQVYIELSYTGDWAYYNRASNDSAQDLDVVSIDRQVGDCRGGCSLSETIAVKIDQKYLITHDQGFRIKIFAKSGDAFILSISKEQVVDQLNVIADNQGNLEKDSVVKATPRKARPQP